MAKRPSLAILIDQFLGHVERGYIVAAPDTLGPDDVLRNMCEALRKILDGADPDEALGIERKKGRTVRPQTFMLALAISNSRAKGEKWAVIEHHVNAYLTDMGEPTLSLPTIKGLPKDYAAEIESYHAMASLRRQITESENSTN